MPNLKRILEVSGGDLFVAESMARKLCREEGDEYLIDLELILSARGEPDKAYEISKLAMKSMTSGPNSDRAAFNHAWHLIREGDLLEGYRHLRRGRNIGVYAKPNIRTSKPILNGHQVKEKFILFQCECGFGDEIAMVRFAKPLVDRGAKVIVGCSDSLMDVFSRIEGVSAVIDKDFSPEVYFDYWVPSMNAVDILGVTYETLSDESYLKPDEKYLLKWRNLILSKKFKIGIRWAGNPQYEQDLWRTIPAANLINSVRREGVSLYSFQRDANLIDLPDDIVDLAPMLKTWDDTIAAMSQMDLMITSCTSIPHMAGALGVNTWVIVPTLAYYIWVHEKDGRSSWYKSVRVFHQKKFNDWDCVLKEVKEGLKCLT